ncbi:MAG: hypothetical protein AAF414_19575 [Pseudomonadota bacterium]
MGLKRIAFALIGALALSGCIQSDHFDATGAEISAVEGLIGEHELTDLDSGDSFLAEIVSAEPGLYEVLLPDGEMRFRLASLEIGDRYLAIASFPEEGAEEPYLYGYLERANHGSWVVYAPFDSPDPGTLDVNALQNAAAAYNLMIEEAFAALQLAGDLSVANISALFDDEVFVDLLQPTPIFRMTSP